MANKITPNFWFNNNAVEAAEYYCSIFDNSRVVSKAHYTEDGPGTAGEVMVVEWELDGQRFVGINGGPEFTFSEAISMQVNCDTQEEIDYYWDKFVGDGGEEGPCGWCKDKFGLSWQVTPKGMDELFSDPDKSKANRAMQAMLTMKKLDIAALQAAAEGEPAPAA
jgi:predicted 3-demethylubiquinone-9 3-methyltransferase (glyoxalase superfamily)